MDGRGTSMKRIGDHLHIVMISGFFLLGGIQAFGVTRDARAPKLRCV